MKNGKRKNMTINLTPRKKGSNEPHFTEIPKGIEITEAFNFYSYDFTSKDGIKFLLTYLKDNDRMEDYEIVEKAKEWEISSSACWIARMLSNGSVLPETSLEHLNKSIEELKIKLDSRPEVPATAPRTKPNVQKNIKDKAYALIDTIEKMIEESNYIYFSIFEFLKSKNISGEVAKHIHEFFDLELKEFVNIKTDPQLREAYRFLTVEDIEQRITFFNRFQRDVLTYMIYVTKGNELVALKPPIASLTDYKYLSAKDKLVSINPKEIIGAKALWTLNVKTNFIHYLVADGSLDIKGSRVVNVDFEKSWAKITSFDRDEILSMIWSGRDPLEIKAKIKNGTVYKAIALSNEFTIILRAIK